MTIHLLFFTVTFKLNKISTEEALHQVRVKQIREESAEKINQYRYFI